MMPGHVGFRDGAGNKKGIRRRNFLRGIAGAATAWPLGARAQGAAVKIQRIGIIDDSPSWNPFRQELRDLHYVEGQNIVFEYRRADGAPDRLATAAGDLAGIPVNVIAVFGTPAAQARSAPPNQYQLLLSRSAIPSPPAWSRIWRIPAAISPAILFSAPTW
jgi:hypothetical protein